MNENGGKDILRNEYFDIVHNFVNEPSPTGSHALRGNRSEWTFRRPARLDAERRQQRSHAERGNEQGVCTYFRNALVIWIVCIISQLGFQTPVLAASTHQLVAKGNTLFSAGKYDEALEVYEQAEVNVPESPYLYFNKGTALYKKGDYAAATEAFQQAALKSKEIALEAKSKFNLGLCAVREAERQQDSDLNKALDAYGKSIQYFRETLELDHDFQEAAENIELVRLIMKSILDEIKKREEEAKKQQEQMQKAVEQLKALIERQQDLIERNSSLSQEAQQNGQSENSEMQNLANEQGALQHDTQQLADTLANQKQNAQGAQTEAVTHLNNSVKEQGLAVQQLEQNHSQTAGEHQQNSLESLIKALESLTQQQQQGRQQQEQQQQGQQQARTGQQENTSPDQEQEQAGSEQEQQQEKQQQASVVQLPDDAESILDEEKENNMRRMYGNTSGGYSEVDKDW